MIELGMPKWWTSLIFSTHIYCLIERGRWGAADVVNRFRLNLC